MSNPIDFAAARADRDLARALAKYGFTLDGFAEALKRSREDADPGRLLSDVELDAAEAVVRAAIRWTDVKGPTKVASSFDLIMAELRRLRSKA